MQLDNLKQLAVNPHIAMIDIMQPHIVYGPHVELRRYFPTVIFDLRRRVPSPFPEHPLLASCMSVVVVRFVVPRVDRAFATCGRLLRSGIVF